MDQPQIHAHFSIIKTQKNKWVPFWHEFFINYPIRVRLFEKTRTNLMSQPKMESAGGAFGEHNSRKLPISQTRRVQANVFTTIQNIKL